jgi:hypothetical protein
VVAIYNKVVVTIGLEMQLSPDFVFTSSCVAGSNSIERQLLVSNLLLNLANHTKSKRFFISLEAVSLTEASASVKTLFWARSVSSSSSTVDPLLPVGETGPLTGASLVGRLLLILMGIFSVVHRRR